VIQAVLFDLGGTLHVCSSDEKTKLRFAKLLLERLGEYDIHLDMTPQALSEQLQINGEIYKRASEESLRELEPVVIWNDYYLKEQKLGRERLAPIAEELSFRYDYERVRNLRRPGMLDCMRRLKDMGLRLGVISNIISRSIVPHFMAEYDLEDIMDVVLTSAGTGIRKPSPLIFRMAEQQLGLEAAHLAYVGDTLSRDVLGVRNAGWRLAIQIENPNSAHRDAAFIGTGLEPDYRIRSLEEIPAIIETENARF